MVKVKILKGNAPILERDINDFLEAIGRRPEYKVGLQDIKLIEAGGPDMLTGLIIYTESLRNADK